MRFMMNMFNHSEIGQRSLEDVIGIFGHQLRALGHIAQWDTTNANFYGPEGNTVNVIVEGFVPQHEGFFSAARQRGCRFLMLATEEPTQTGFNHGIQREMELRQRDFPACAKYFDGIFYLVPGQFTHEWYNQFAPAAYLELGYAPSLMRVRPKEPKYDFGFYGSVTARRHSLLKKLAKRTLNPFAVRVVSDFKTQTERDEAMSEAKVILQLRKFDKMGLVSSSRCNTALHLGRPVVAEPHELSKPWDEVVRFTNTMEGFFNTAVMVAKTWKHVHAEQVAKFKDKFSPEICVGEPLRRIGITEEMFTKEIAA
jgi:hypothetical protein